MLNSSTTTLSAAFQKLFIFLIVFFISTMALHAQADILSEGWYKLLLGQQHIGYIVQRFELDKKKNQVVMTSFLRTNTLGGDITESIQAFSTVGFEPVAYQYSILKGKDASLIDGRYIKEKNKSGKEALKGTVKVTEKGKDTILKDDIPSGSFLSYFLGYVMTSYKNPKDPKDSGIRVGRSFNYNAIAEEDGRLSTGSADVMSTEKVNGHDVFRVRVKFKDIQSFSFMTAEAEVLQINQPISGHQIKIALKEDATKGFPSSEKSLKTLFGTIPADNRLALAASPAAPVVPSSSKGTELATPNTTSEAVPPEEVTQQEPLPSKLPKKKEDKLGVEPNLEMEEGKKILIPPGKPFSPPSQPQQGQ